MKGATSCGPRACVTMSATASTAACATSVQAREPAMTNAVTRGGMYCDPIPTAIASSTARDQRRGLAPAREEPVIISQATSNVSERKKIQAKQTTWKVTSRRQ